MQEGKFSKDARVKIRKGTEYDLQGDTSNPRGVEGTIMELRERTDFIYNVKWDNEEWNTYRKGDLDLLSDPKAEFKVGDQVTVTNSGNTYDTYSDMFKLLGFKDEHSNPGFSDGDTLKIVGMTYHEFAHQGVLYHVKDSNGNEALMGEKGLKLADKAISKTVEVDAEFIKEAHKAADTAMQQKIEKKFPDLFEPKDERYTFSVGQTLSTYFGDLPFMIGKSAVRKELSMKSLIVSAEYQIELTKTSGGHQVISFKKKTS